MYSVIMAGGSGTRFWPASRRHRPKQLLSLAGERSLIRQTVDRMAPLTGPEQVLVITGQSHARQIAAQLTDVPSDQVVAEPMARNTAAAVGLAAAIVAKRDPREVCLVLPADHLINDEALFIKTLQTAADLAAKEDVLVTLGLTPTYPATGFGYIETGKVLVAEPPQVREVAAFREKPQREVAEQYLAGGRHLWNSGMFAWRAEVILAQLGAHLPELTAGLAELTPHLGTPRQGEALAEIYPRLPKISIDYAVMEKSRDIRVVKADFGWSDLGSWEAMEGLWPVDGAGNLNQSGRTLAIDAAGNVVSCGDRLAALLGVRDLVVVVTDDAVLVGDKARCQDVGKIIDKLTEEGLEEYL